MDLALDLVDASLVSSHPFWGELEAIGEQPPWLQIYWNNASDTCLVSRRHGLAALCLHEQPFGFTRGDVIDLATAVNDARQLAIAAPQLREQSNALAARLSNLAERIAALLPPANDA